MNRGRAGLGGCVLMCHFWGSIQSNHHRTTSRCRETRDAVTECSTVLFYGMRTMFIRLLVNPEATLCFIDKGEAVLLPFCTCVTLGGVWTTAGFDFCSLQLGSAVVMCLYLKVFLTWVSPFPFPVSALRPHSQRPQRCLGPSRAPRSSIWLTIPLTVFWRSIHPPWSCFMPPVSKKASCD